jgi:lipopolysaccharide export system protein LptA
MNRPLANFALFVAGALVLLAPLRAIALTSDRQQPIRIEANRVEIDERQGTSTYIGSVQVTQGTFRLNAQRVVVHRGREAVQRIVAHGDPATFQQQPEGADYLIRGQARELRYEAGDGTVALTGAAHLWQGRDEFSGARVIYELERERVRAEGGSDNGRVRAIIHPQKKGGEQ